jgi:hypothetical protein
MNRSLLKTVFIFSFGVIPQQAMAMDEPDWWGAQIEGHSSIRMSVPEGEELFLYITDITGLSGKVYAPIVIIKHFSETAKKDLSKFLTIKANYLLINSRIAVIDYAPFTPQVACPQQLKLVLNSKDVRESQKLSRPLSQTPAQAQNEDPLPFTFASLNLNDKGDEHELAAQFAHLQATDEVVLPGHQKVPENLLAEACDKKNLTNLNQMAKASNAQASNSPYDLAQVYERQGKIDDAARCYADAMRQGENQAKIALQRLSEEGNIAALEELFILAEADNDYAQDSLTSLYNKQKHAQAKTCNLFFIERHRFNREPLS